MSLWNEDVVYDSPHVAELVDAPRFGTSESFADKHFEIESALDSEVSDRDRLNLMMALLIGSQEHLDDLAERSRDLVAFVRSGAIVEPSHSLDALSIAAATSAICGDTGTCLDLCAELVTGMTVGGVELSQQAKTNVAATLHWLGAYRLAASYLVEIIEVALKGDDPTRYILPSLNLLVSVSRQMMVAEQDGDGPADITEHEAMVELAERAFDRAIVDAPSESLRNVALASRAYSEVLRGDLDAGVQLWGDLDALAMHPAENFTAYLALVEAHLRFHQGADERTFTLLDAALVDLKTYDGLPLRKVEALQLRSELHHRRGDAELAIVDMRRALRLALREASELPTLLIDELSRRAEAEQSNEALLERTSELTEQAFIDGLTGLNNRRALDRRMGELREGTPGDLVVLVVDIDEFKRINDTFGHQVGDQAIALAGELIARSCRSVDHVVRYGGEEFVVIPKSGSFALGVTLAERIRAAFVVHDWSGIGVQGPVTCSIGVASGMSTRVDGILRVADERLYRAKRSGRDAVVSSASLDSVGQE